MWSCVVDNQTTARSRTGKSLYVAGEFPALSLINGQLLSFNKTITRRRTACQLSEISWSGRVRDSLAVLSFGHPRRVTVYPCMVECTRVALALRRANKQRFVVELLPRLLVLFLIKPPCLCKTEGVNQNAGRATLLSYGSIRQRLLRRRLFRIVQRLEQNRSSTIRGSDFNILEQERLSESVSFAAGEQARTTYVQQIIASEKGGGSFPYLQALP